MTAEAVGGRGRANRGAEAVLLRCERRCPGMAALIVRRFGFDTLDQAEVPLGIRYAH